MRSPLKLVIKIAWDETYVADPKERDFNGEWKFTKNFFKYLSSGSIPYKIFYVISLQWLTNLVVNSLKLFEFLGNIISASCVFLKEKVPLLEIPFTIIQYLSRAISLLFKAVFSPIDSAKAAYDKNVWLGLLSLIISISIYSSLIVFAAPLLFATLPKLSLFIAEPVIRSIGLVGSFLSNLFGVPSTLATLATFAGAIYFGINSLFSYLFSSSKSSSLLPSTISPSIKTDLNAFSNLYDSAVIKDNKPQAKKNIDQAPPIHYLPIFETNSKISVSTEETSDRKCNSISNITKNI